MNKQIRMKTQLSKSVLKKMVSLAGVVSASLFLNFPAFALINSNATVSNQVFNNHNSKSDFTLRSKEVLAQSKPSGRQLPAEQNDEVNQGLPSGVNNGENKPSPSRDNNTGDKPRGDTPPIAPDANNAGVKPGSPSQSTSNIQPGSWACINNPNPQCRG